MKKTGNADYTYNKDIENVVYVIRLQGDTRVEEFLKENGKGWEVMRRIKEIRKVRLKEKEMIEKDDKEEEERRQ